MSDVSTLAQGASTFLFSGSNIKYLTSLGGNPVPIDKGMMSEQNLISELECISGVKIVHE